MSITAAQGNQDAVSDTAQTSVIPPDLEEQGLAALQRAFQNVAARSLPTVVEINVVEVVHQQNLSPYPFPGFSFPFGFPQKPEGQQEREFRKQGLGSGVIIRRDGNLYYAVTNNHVVGKADEISIRLYDGRVYEGRLTGKDPRTDLALVEFESRDELPILTPGDSNTLTVGDIVFCHRKSSRLRIYCDTGNHKRPEEKGRGRQSDR